MTTIYITNTTKISAVVVNGESIDAGLRKKLLGTEEAARRAPRQ
jgi:hypothetical protein